MSLGRRDNEYQEEPQGLRPGGAVRASPGPGGARPPAVEQGGGALPFSQGWGGDSRGAVHLGRTERR